MNETEYYIANHYFCQSCLTDRFNFRFFKKLGKWVECAKNGAEIGIQFCEKCNNFKRVHENAIIDRGADRPWRYIFYDFKSQKELSSKISLNLFKKIFN